MRLPFSTFIRVRAITGAIRATCFAKIRLTRFIPYGHAGRFNRAIAADGARAETFSVKCHADILNELFSVFLAVGPRYSAFIPTKMKNSI